jgi:hypothetical protein
MPLSCMRRAPRAAQRRADLHQLECLAVVEMAALVRMVLRMVAAALAAPAPAEVEAMEVLQMVAMVAATAATVDPEVPADLAVPEAQDFHGLRRLGQQRPQQRLQWHHGEPTPDSWRNPATSTATCQLGESGDCVSRATWMRATTASAWP